MLRIYHLVRVLAAAGCLGIGRAKELPKLELPGARPDGSILLPNQWSLRPAGKQVSLGDFPVNIAVHPSGKYAVVLHAGYGSHELVSVAIPAGKMIARARVEEAFYGVVFAPDGFRIYCSGAGEEVVHSLAFKEGNFSDPQVLRLRGEKERGIPAGLAISSDGTELFATEVYGQGIVSGLLSAGGAGFTPRYLSLHAQVAPDLAATRLSTDPNLAAAEKRIAAQRDVLSADAPFPYGCSLDTARNRLYVTLWGRAEVAVIDLTTRTVVAHWPTEEHPNELLLAPDGSRLFVANANRNTVSVFDAATGKVSETLSAAMQPEELPGSTPNSLALSPDGRLLFVANAGNNNVAVFDLEHPGHARSLGFIPVGWYPTSVRVTPDGRHLLVANGKGLTSRANRHGPQAGREVPGNVEEYIGGLLLGTLSIIPLPALGEPLNEAMAKHTERAFRCTPQPTQPQAPVKRDRENPIPAVVGGKSPIKYVLYIIKENRTYDQVLGDLSQGNGDPGLCLFDERITPNHHRLAKEFVLLDNFYVDGEVSADGHEWTVGAYATDFVEKNWPLSYGHNTQGKYPYPAEGNFPIASPANGYLWDRAREAGVSYRSYGQFIALPANPTNSLRARVKSLEGHFDPGYRPWDMDYPDVKRADRFLSELQRFEREGKMPRLQIIRLPNDHTFGTTVGKRTPRAMVADNDLALGRLVEGVTRSKFWPTTAIFVVEDDAQNGPDHVDAHRTIAFAMSPYVKHQFRDSTLYSTCSMLRTMELILGLKPLSQFDAHATPMYRAFQARPDRRTYTAVTVSADRDEKNLADNWGAAASAAMDFSKEDAADDLQLNEVVWRSVKGAGSPMPSPRRAAFVRGGDDDD